MIHLAFYLGRKKENPSSTWLDNLICFVTRSRYSHVEVIYDWSKYSKFGRCFSSSIRDGGVRGNTLNFSTGHWEVYSANSDITERQAEQFLMNHYGKPYDLWGSIGIIIPFIKQRQNKWFCSELAMFFLGYEKSYKYTPQKMFDRLTKDKIIQSRVL